MTLLTVRKAATRIERSTRQVERYIAAGLPVVKDGRVRYVREDQLLEVFRRHLLANPTRGTTPKDERHSETGEQHG